MIKLERFEVMNFENAMRGARNPLNSWARMDSKTENGVFTFGPNDLDLAKRLCKAGSDHRKFIRQIFPVLSVQRKSVRKEPVFLSMIPKARWRMPIGYGKSSANTAWTQRSFSATD